MEVMMKTKKIRIMFTNADIVTEHSKSLYLLVGIFPRPTTVRVTCIRRKWRSEHLDSKIVSIWQKQKLFSGLKLEWIQKSTAMLLQE